MTPPMELSIARRETGGMLINWSLYHVYFPELKGVVCSYLNSARNVYVLLTVHLSISLDNDQLDRHLVYFISLTLILPRSRTGTVWFYTSTSNKRAARPKLYTKSLTRD